MLPTYSGLKEPLRDGKGRTCTETKGKNRMSRGPKTEDRGARPYHQAAEVLPTYSSPKGPLHDDKDSTGTETKGEIRPSILHQRGKKRQNSIKSRPKAASRKKTRPPKEERRCMQSRRLLPTYSDPPNGPLRDGKGNNLDHLRTDYREGDELLPTYSDSV